MQYTSKFSGEEVDSILDSVRDKQDAIPDLETIRNNAKNASDTIARMVGSGYLFAGIATIDTNPSTPDAKVFYIANGKGTYEKFGGLEVTEDDVVVLYWDSAWHKVATGIASQEKLSELVEKMPKVDDDGGFRIVDENGNIAFEISAGGITKFLTSLLYLFGNNGDIYLVDENGTVGMKMSSTGNIDVNISTDSFVKAFNIASSLLTLYSKDDVTFLESIKPNPLSIIKPVSSFASIIHSWGFIGDSLSSGEFEYHEGDQTKYIDMYDYSWGQRFCKLCGVDGYNFSQGGQSAKGWCQGSSDRTWGGASVNPKQGYIIALGVNDRSKSLYPVGDLSTDVDMVDYNNNADTYAGWMAGIVQRLKSIQPKCKIFVVTDPKGDDTWNNIVRGLTTKFTDVFLIDLALYAPSYAGAFSSMFFNGGHMNAMGYEYTAYMMATYIDWIIRNNINSFKQVSFIGTDYEF